MVQKIHPWGVIWVPSIPPHAIHLSKKQNDDIDVQYEDVHGLRKRVEAGSSIRGDDLIVCWDFAPQGDAKMHQLCI